MTRDALNIQDLAIRFDRSLSWMRKHWREIEGLPRPFIGAGLYGHARWRKAEIDAFMQGQHFPPAPASDTAAKGPGPRARENQRAKMLQKAGCTVGTTE